MIKSRIFLFLLLSFVVGVALRSFVQVPVIFIWVMVSCGTALAVFAIAQSKKKIAVYGFLLVVLALGIFRFEQAKNSDPDLSRLYGKEVVLRGYVTEDPERTLKIQRLKFWVESIGEEKIFPGFYVLISLERYPRYKIGDEFMIQDTLDEPENFAEFDYVSYLSKNDIFSSN